MTGRIKSGNLTTLRNRRFSGSIERRIFARARGNVGGGDTKKVLWLLVAVCSTGGHSALAGDVPDLMKTPGVARVDLTKAQICTIKWGKDERHVSATMKQKVFALYGYTGNDDPRCVPRGKRHCEIDHLISRELGGADVVENLWPQAYGTSPWNAVLKDKLETRLHREMCAGRISLKQARSMLVNDWRSTSFRYTQS